MLQNNSLDSVTSTNLLEDILHVLPKQSLTLDLFNFVPTTIQQSKPIHHQITDNNLQRETLTSTDIEFNQLNYEEAFYRPRIIESMLMTQIQTPSEEMEDTDSRNNLLKTLLKIQGSFSHKHNIIHLAGSIIDRYLIKLSVSKEEYLKLGITALWISDKLLYKKPWPLKMWISYLQGSTIEQLIEMESVILREMDYYILTPTAINFLEIFSTYFQVQRRDYLLCIKLIEVTLIGCQFKQFKESEIALSCLELYDRNRSTFEEFRGNEREQREPQERINSQLLDIIYDTFNVQKQNVLKCMELLNSSFFKAQSPILY